MLGPPYRRLLRSAEATEDLFVTRGLHQEPPPRIPTGQAWMSFTIKAKAMAGAMVQVVAEGQVEAMDAVVHEAVDTVVAKK